MDIRRLQRSTDLLIRQAPFARVVREIAHNYTTEPYRFTAESLLALQEATEDLLVRCALARRSIWAMHQSGSLAEECSSFLCLRSETR